MRPLRRILVVDDSPEDRAIIRRLLLSDRGADISIEEASTGEEGLAISQRGGHDVIFLDLHLPGLDGLGVLRELRTRGGGATVPCGGGAPVVALTGSLAGTLASEALALGAVDFLVKDELTPTVLARAVSNAIIRAELQRRLEESASQLTSLVTLSSALSAEGTQVKVIDILLGQGLQAAGAAAGFVALLGGDGRELVMAGHRGDALEDDGASGRGLLLESHLPASEAVRSGELVTCPTLAERDKRYPALRQTARSMKALAALPLVAGDGPLGVLFVSYADEREFTGVFIAFLRLLARVCAQALQRARTQESERRAKEQLGIVAQRYRALVEAGTPVIWRTDERGQTVSITRAWHDLTGQTDADANGSGWIDAVHPEDRERTLRTWNGSLSTSSIYVNEFRVRDRRGGWRCHEARAVPVLDESGRVREWIGANVDVTERRVLEEEQAKLRAEAERRAAELQAVLESIPDGVFMGDWDRVHYANRLALGMLGLDGTGGFNPLKAEALREGYDVRDSATGALLPFEQSGYARALREGTKSVMELQVLHKKDGREIILRATSVPVVVQGKIVAAVTVHADITESKRAHELLTASADFEKHLIGIVSHDLKNPLHTILMQARMILQGSVSGSVRTGIERIERAARRSDQLISDLLDFAKGRSGGGFSITRGETNLAEVVEQAVAAFRVSNPAREIILSAEGNLGGSWDRERLDQMITNLVANALQHGGATAPVVVKLREQEDRSVVFEVLNRGEPISRDLLPHLFKPFGASSGQRNSRNVGLGLFIVAQIVKAHEGTIQVTSTTTEGTRFIVQLPRHTGGWERILPNPKHA